MLIYILIGCLYIIATIIRIIQGQPFYKSMQMAVESYFPISLFFLILYNKFDFKKVINSLITAVTIINLYVFFHVIKENSFRPNIILNTNVVVLLAISSIFINAFYINSYKVNTVQEVRSVFNFCYSTIIILFAGSRTGIVEGIACVFIILFILKKKLMFIRAVFLGIIISSIIFATNFGGSQGLMARATNLGTFSVSSKSMSESENQSLEVINSKLQEAVNEGDQDQILVANDMGRILLWSLAIEEIKKAPFWGTGEVSFLLGYSSSKQSAHNFLLEYTLIYGVIGLLFWLIFTTLLLTAYYRQIISYNRKTIPWMTIYAIFVCAFSCMQPTLSTLQVTLFFWGIMGVFFIAPKEEALRDQLVIVKP